LLADLGCNSEGCLAAVRAPPEPGDSRAWRHVDLPRALDHRPVPGGRLLVAVELDERTLRLVLTDGRASHVLVDRISVDGDLLAWRIDEEGRVLLDIRHATHAEPVEHLVLEDGSLQLLPTPVRSDPTGANPCGG
jgi:hypothetical protein